MADYIDREQALEALCIRCLDGCSKHCAEYTRLKSVPSADVQPVIHGHWKLYDICSVCDDLNEFQTNYCPNCGARMDEYDEVD